MKFIAGGLNGEYLIDLANKSIGKTKSVYAVIAYASSDPELLKICKNNQIPIKFWGRYDRSVPITTTILKKFLDTKSPSYECKLVPDILHAKVIWWKDFGTYIGSANLTEQGWYGNIEAGVFIEHVEIVENDLEDGLINFFDEIDNKSFPLTEEVYNELYIWERKNNRIEANLKVHEDEFRQKRIIPPLNPLTRIVKKSSVEKIKNAFILEWNQTLQLLRNIADRVSDDKYRPDWVKSNVPKGVQADQFLHAYYYTNVRKGTKALHHEFYEENFSDPEKGLINAMYWWRSLDKPPHSEDITINEWAPYLREKLDKNYILTLTVEEFIMVCSRVHAMRDHSLRVKYTEFGLSEPLPTMEGVQRRNFFSKWLYQQKSTKNKSVLDTIHYVLYDGNPDALTNRLWEAVTEPEWFIPHLGISSLGEMTGWAMPDKFPPRNGRTSKALYALGNKVRIHSE